MKNESSETFHCTSEIRDRRDVVFYNENHSSMGPVPRCVWVADNSKVQQWPSRLKRHWTVWKGHDHLKRKDLVILSGYRNLKQCKTLEKKSHSGAESRLSSSRIYVLEKERSHYQVKKPDIASKVLVSKMPRQDTIRETGRVSLSKNTVSQHVDDMSRGWRGLRNKLKNSSFSIQVDISTDYTNTCHSVAFVRFVSDEIQESFSRAKGCPKQVKASMYFLLLLFFCFCIILFYFSLQLYWGIIDMQ